MSRVKSSIIVLLGAILAAFAIASCGGDDGGDETTFSVPSDPEAVSAEQQDLAEAEEVGTKIDASDVIKTFPPTIVRPGDIDAEKANSPERALLEWWQAFQFGDAAVVEDLTSPATLKAVGKDKLEQAVMTLGLSGLEVLGANVSGSEASVQAGLLNFQPSASGKLPKKPTASTPETFQMAKDGGQWLFDATEFLELRVASLN